MKSKLKLLAIVVPGLSVVIATAIAQAQDPTPAASPSRNSSQGEGTSAAGSPARDLFNVIRNTGSYSDPVYTTTFGQNAPAATFYGHANDWRLHNNEDATIAQIVQQLKNAKSDDVIDKLKRQLDEALEKSFALRQERHTHEIAELEAKVKTLKELVAKRQEKRREIVANRREQILREAQGLGW